MSGLALLLQNSDNEDAHNQPVETSSTLEQEQEQEEVPVLHTPVPEGVSDASTMRVVSQLSSRDLHVLKRTSSSPIAFTIGNHVPLVRPNATAQASNVLRQDFLEQAIQKDDQGVIHGNLFILYSDLFIFVFCFYFTPLELMVLFSTVY
jgi:hypothetical protein